MFCDLFAGTGVLSSYFSRKGFSVIANDTLFSNYVPLKAFLETTEYDKSRLRQKIEYLNNLTASEDNYFSASYGGTFFTEENARKAGMIREAIDAIADDQTEFHLLLATLIYAVDKVANTVGHYNGYRSDMHATTPIKLFEPFVQCETNEGNTVSQTDANLLAREIEADILYIDPPYNSRHYSHSYHVLENLSTWNKPELHGKLNKMNCKKLNSDYCTNQAPDAFKRLVQDANCRCIVVSYNSTGISKTARLQCQNQRSADCVCTGIKGEA